MTHTTPPTRPARALTLDHAYSLAYADLRARVLHVAEEEPDYVRRRRLEEAAEASAHRLALDLSELLLGEHLASALARPE